MKIATTYKPMFQEEQGSVLRFLPSSPSLPPNSDSSESGMLSRLGDLLFYTIAEGQERIPIHKFTSVSFSTCSGP